METILESHSPPEPVTRKTVEDYLKVQGLLDQLGSAEVERFAMLAIRFQLNPFLRELHLATATEQGVKRSVAVVGYETYLKRAERTGKLDGWRSFVEGEGDGMKAVLEIYRHDWGHPFVHEVHYAEAVQRSEDGSPTYFWKRMPKFQLRKVCISQGFRLCFPEELGGIPYEPAELTLDEGRASPHQSATQGSTAKPANTATPGADQTAFGELESYLVANAAMFRTKHLQWIRDQLVKTPTVEKAKAMVRYARKVVMEGGDEPEPAKPARGYGNRGTRKPDYVPEPTF